MNRNQDFGVKCEGLGKRMGVWGDEKDGIISLLSLEWSYRYDVYIGVVVWGWVWVFSIGAKF